MQATLKEIEPVYSDMVAADVHRLKELGNLCDYPSFADYARSWQLVVDFRPVPQTGDYRVSVPQEITDGLEQQLQDLGVTTKKLLRDTIKKEFSDLMETLKKPDGERRLFNSALVNLEDLLTRTKTLNVLNDDDLNNVCDRLTTVISQYDVADLRKFPDARTEFNLSVTKELETL